MTSALDRQRLLPPLESGPPFHSRKIRAVLYGHVFGGTCQPSWSMYHTFHSSFPSNFYTTLQIVTAVLTIGQMSRLRFKEMRSQAQVHASSKWQTRSLNLVLQILSPNPWLDAPRTLPRHSAKTPAVAFSSLHRNVFSFYLLNLIEKI